MNPTNQIILVLYYSRHGKTRRLAELIGQGIDSVPGLDARLRSRRCPTSLTDHRRQARAHDRLDACPTLRPPAGERAAMRPR